MQRKNRFDSVTNRKILKGALIAGGGVLATILLQAVMQMDFGQYTFIVAGVCSILINVIKEFTSGSEM